MEEIRAPQPAIHLFVCVNDRTGRPGNTMPSCGPTVTREMVKEVKQWIREQGWVQEVYCTKVLCLGFCNPIGGVARVFPSGRFFKGIRSVDDVKNIICDERSRLEMAGAP